MILPDYVLAPMRRLTDAGYEVYCVGGCVRDALLGRPVHDYDLTTSALPEQVHDVFRDAQIIDTGIKHGTVTLIIDHRPLEITTFRTESAYRDHRHPDHVAFARTLKDDCARRDFTINALAYHPDTGITDHFHGLDDLKAGIIRSVNDPSERFNEDALRILRAVRFAAQLGFRIEEKTAEAVLAKKDDLRYVSAERIEAELERLLTGQYAASVLDPYRSLMEVILPQLKNDTAWENTVSCIDRSERTFPVRLAVLLNHTETDQRTLDDLKVSGAVRDTVLVLQKYRSLPLETKIDVQKAMYLLKDRFSDYLAYRTAADCYEKKDELERIAREIRENGDCVSLTQLAVNGSDLVKEGLRGKEISVMLDHLINAVMEERCKNTRESLLEEVRKSADQGA